MTSLRLLTAMMLAGATLSLPASAEDAPGDAVASLQLELTGLAPQTGAVRVALFADEDSYESGPPFRGVVVPVDETTETWEFDGLVPGEYAIKLFHDIDGDEEMATNPFGIPTEPYGFSNNARGNFGPAKWEKARFAVEAGENSHAISLGN